MHVTGETVQDPAGPILYSEWKNRNLRSNEVLHWLVGGNDGMSESIARPIPAQDGDLLNIVENYKPMVS